jgi:hypothetical protein
MEPTPEVIKNLIIHMKKLEDRVLFLEDKLEQMEHAYLPVILKNFYYNNFPNVDKIIMSESKLFIDTNTELGLNIMNRIMLDISDPNTYFAQKQQSMRLFKDFEIMDNDIKDFIANEHNSSIIIPRNMIIKVWYNPAFYDTNTASIYYEGTYDPSIFRYGMVIWMGTIECMDCLPNKL